MLDEIPNTRRIVEDIVVYSATYKEHIQAVRAVLKKAAAHNVAINSSKKVFAQPSVVFGGHVVSSDGFRPDPGLTRAIREFPQPQSATDTRSFFGLCQQVYFFSKKVVSSPRPPVF